MSAKVALQDKRAKGRAYQARYLQRQQQRLETAENEVDKWRAKVKEAQLINDSIRESIVTQLSSRIAFRGSILDTYADVFRYGAVPKYERKQLALLDAYFAPKFQFASKESPMGPRSLHHVWGYYTSLFPNILATRGPTFTHDTEANIVQVAFHCRFPVTRQAIEQMYIHVLEDEDLTQKVIGKTLEYEMTHTAYFNDNGRIEFMGVECEVTAAWDRVLDNARDALKVYGQQTEVGRAVCPFEAKAFDEKEKEANAMIARPSVASPTTDTEMSSPVNSELSFTNGNQPSSPESDYGDRVQSPATDTAGSPGRPVDSPRKSDSSNQPGSPQAESVASSSSEMGSPGEETCHEVNERKKMMFVPESPEWDTNDIVRDPR